MAARFASTLILVAAVMLGVPGAASADYYLSRGEAESFARYDAKDRYADYGVTNPAAVCRPQGARAPRRGYIYHRWVCGWGRILDDGSECGGVILIKGSSRSRDHYYSRVLSGMRCE